MIGNSMGVQADTLHLLVTRHPYEWLSSMRQNGFYATFHKNQDMLTFLTLEWMSVDLSADDQARFGLPRTHLRLPWPVLWQHGIERHDFVREPTSLKGGLKSRTVERHTGTNTN
jgi:hypothetical protein